MALDPNLFIHEDDRATLNALKAIPGFTPFLKGFMKVWNEKLLHIFYMANYVRINDNQMPAYYDILKDICQKLEIDVPELYMMFDPNPNAFTTGDTKPMIVMTSGLIETVPEELIPTILAHECGHILCHHVLYTTMGQFLLDGAIWGAHQGTAGNLGLGDLISFPLQLAFSKWMRCSEYSADRVACVYDSTSDKLVDMCMRFAGYDKDIPYAPNKEEFVAQAKEYKELIDESAVNKAMEFLQFMYNDHPVNSVRAYECIEWAKTDVFNNVVRYLKEGSSDDSHARIPMTSPSSAYVGKDYKDNIKAFTDMGFRNVSGVKQIEKGILTKEGQTLSISIDGNNSFKMGDWFDADAPCVITYYEAETYEEALAKHPGQAKLPNNTTYYMGKPYEDVEKELRDAGFTNINIRYGETRKKDLFSKDHSVSEIIINGNRQVEKNTWLNSDSDILISYIKLE